MEDRSLRTWVRVSADPIDPAALLAEANGPDCGATALFLGTVRDHSAGHTGVTHLDYEAYEDEVERSVAAIVDEAGAKWEVRSVLVEHRVGVVDLGEASVAVAVAAPHRDAAFEAARYVIDQLKQRAPIWKKEHWPGGSAWSKGS
jgi:molybdopterin synthase catalytic subunit